MNRNWKQMTANLLVLVSLAGQSAFAGGNHGGGSSHHNGGSFQAQGNAGLAARPSSSFQPRVVSGNGGASYKSLSGDAAIQQAKLHSVTPLKASTKFTPVGGFPVNPLPVGPIGPVKPPKVGNPFPPIGPVKPPHVNPLPPIGPIGPVKPPVVNPFPPIGPIGPVKPPVVNPLPPIGPIGPIGPVKPPIVNPLPPIGPIGPIGPIKPLPPIGPLPPLPPINPNPPLPPINPPCHNHCHPNWGCWTGWVGGWFNCPVVQPCPLPLVSVVEVVPVQTTVVVPEVARREIDLAVKEVRVVETGDTVRGPLYRVFVTNKSLTDLDVPTRVALLGVNGGQPTDDTPRAIELLKSLSAGETASLDVRLPATAANCPLLLVVVEVPETYKDTDETNNLAQGEVAQLPLAVAAAR